MGFGCYGNIGLTDLSQCESKSARSVLSVFCYSQLSVKNFKRFKYIAFCMYEF